MLAERQGPDSSDEPLFASEEGRDRLEKALGRYPSARAALLPMLNYAQERNGWVSGRAMKEIAEALDVTPAYVHSVATFYTMYNRRPVGRFLIQVCTNISCHLCGGEEVLEAFLEETGVRLGETSGDRLFTVMEVECLGACGFATVVQVNERYLEDVSPEDVPGIVEQLRQEAAELDDGGRPTPDDAAARPAGDDGEGGQG
jgi:NADH-quinone oxidoreductase E subunit